MKITSLVENTSKCELKASPQVTLLDGDYKIDEELSLLTVTRTGKCQICFIYLAERPLRFDALPCPATVPRHPAPQTISKG